MDRLPPVRHTSGDFPTFRWPLFAAIGLTLASIACDGGGGGEPPPRRRVDAVEAKAPPSTAQADLQSFCDTRMTAEEAKAFVLPPLVDAPPAKAAKWRWINVWATWCKPCIEELPMLETWRSRFRQEGTPIDIVFLSVDDTADALESFRQAHPDVPDSVRIRDRETEMGPWLQTIGLGESASLPIHLFVDAEDKLRCIRLGQVSDRDFANVVALVREG